jgi:hypothetical protein
MHFVLRPFTLLIVFFLYILHSSCKKSSNDCPAAAPIIIKHSGPIIAGWPLHLEAEFQSTAYLYKWSGPNGWEQHYITFASDAYLQTRENMTTADAGEYKLQLVNNGCVEYEGKVVVEVIAAPAPPCNIAANTSTSSVAGVGNYSFGYRNFSASSGHYFISGSQGSGPGGDYMRFAFLGDDLPLPGTYKTDGYFGMQRGKVGLYIGAGTYDFVANPDQTVYVNKVNNKIEVSFCSLRFNNPLSPQNPITVSAKIVQQ